MHVSVRKRRGMSSAGTSWPTWLNLCLFSDRALLWQLRVKRNTWPSKARQTHLDAIPSGASFGGTYDPSRASAIATGERQPSAA